MILAILPLLAGLFSFCLGIVVLVSGTNTKTSKWPFVLFALSVGVWASFISLFELTTHQFAAELFVNVYYSAALFIAYGFLLFALSYGDARVSRSAKWFALLPVLLLLVIILSGGNFVTSVLTQPHDVKIQISTYWLYAALFIAYISIGLMYISRLAAKSARYLHLRALTVWLALCLVGGAVFNLILPGVGQYGLISLGPLFTFVMVFAVFYAIARHGLFDIRLAVVRTVTYMLSLLTLSAIYLFIAYVIFDRVLGQSSNLEQTLMNVALTLMLAFAFQPIKRFFDRFTNKLFYKDNYNADDFFGDLNKLLASTTDLRMLLTRASETIARTFKAEQAFMFVYIGEGRFMTAGTEGHAKLPYADAEALKHLREIVVAADPEVDPAIRRLMASHKTALLMPLYRDNHMIGYVSLGDHRTSTYSRRDRRVLSTTANELVIAIQNALSLQEVKDLNLSLEQRISTATQELRTSNAQLQRLDEAKDEFISMASHQLRTPLTSIKGYLSMIIDGDLGKVSAQQKQILEEAFLSSERMVRLIGDFLNVSRLQTGKFTVEKHPTDLALLVQHEIDSLVPSANARGIQFVYRCPKKLPMINIDEGKIQQVVMNFADNAIYYSRDGSKIRISVAVKDDWIEYIVKDQGIGVPAAQQEQLFQKFFRAVNARQQRPDGTGVGLFLAKKVIDAHKGQIIFESKENKGSTFGFRLPLK